MFQEYAFCLWGAHWEAFRDSPAPLGALSVGVKQGPSSVAASFLDPLPWPQGKGSIVGRVSGGEPPANQAKLTHLGEIPSLLLNGREAERGILRVITKSLLPVASDWGSGGQCLAIDSSAVEGTLQGAAQVPPDSFHGACQVA